MQWESRYVATASWEARDSDAAQSSVSWSSGTENLVMLSMRDLLSHPWSWGCWDCGGADMIVALLVALRGHLHVLAARLGGILLDASSWLRHLELDRS